MEYFCCWAFVHEQESLQLPSSGSQVNWGVSAPRAERGAEPSVSLQCHVPGEGSTTTSCGWSGGQVQCQLETQECKVSYQPLGLSPPAFHTSLFYYPVQQVSQERSSRSSFLKAANQSYYAGLEVPLLFSTPCLILLAMEVGNTLCERKAPQIAGNR